MLTVLSSFLDSLPPMPKFRAKPSQTASMSPAPALPLLGRAKRGGIDVSLQDRWLILGATGAGKTTFARELVRELDRLYPDVPTYILDSKGYGDFAEWHSNGGLWASEDIPPAIEHGIQVWQPGVDDMAAYANWFDQLLRRPGPLKLLIDEIVSVSDKKGDAPKEFEKILKLGRALGKLTINLSQEMAKVPKQIKTQTTHVARFRMANTGYDNQRANAIMGRANNDPEPSEPFGFFYRRLDRMMPVTEYASWQDFF